MAPVLAELGAWDLDPRGDDDDLEAAAALCRSAGYWALAYPVAERLCRPADLDVDGLVVVADTAPAAAVAGLTPALGRRHPGRPPQPGDRPPGGRATPRQRPSSAPARPAARSTTATGARRRGPRAGAAVLDAARHARPGHRPDPGLRARARAVRPAARVVPGRPVPADRRRGRAQRRRGAGQVRAVEHRGRPAASARAHDALALRLAALEAAEVVFRVAHQLHGAIGFCDETPLSWLSRYSQPLRRLPLGLSATRDQLTRTSVATAWPGSSTTHEPTPSTAELDEFRAEVAAWCAEPHPARLARRPDRRERRGVRRLPAVVVPGAARRRLRRAPLAGGVGRRHVDRPADRALPGAGRPRRAPAGAGLRRRSTTPRPRCWPPAPTSSASATCPPSWTARSGARASPSPTPARTWPAWPPPPRHGAASSTATRRLRRQRAEGVGQRRPARRLVPAAGPHRSRRPQARRHLLLPDGHALAGHRRPPHPPGHRRVALLRDVPQRRRRSRPPSWSVPRTGAGRWPRRRSAPSGA